MKNDPVRLKAWNEAREKMRSYILWRRILGLRIFHTGCLVDEDCHGSDILCSHTKKCCIYCEDPTRCSYNLCGCIKARDAILNYWYCEDEVIKEADEKEPWEV